MHIKHILIFFLMNFVGILTLIGSLNNLYIYNLLITFIFFNFIFVMDIYISKIFNNLSKKLFDENITLDNYVEPKSFLLYGLIFILITYLLDQVSSVKDNFVLFELLYISIYTIALYILSLFFYPKNININKNR